MRLKFTVDSTIVHDSSLFTVERNNELAPIKPLCDRVTNLVKYSDFLITLKNFFGKCTLFVLSANG